MTTSPDAAVMLAYSELEQTIRAAWTIAEMRPPTSALSTRRMLDRLTASGSLAPDFREVASGLTELRNGVVHGFNRASSAGAQDFIAACRRLSDALTDQAKSRLRHPSRSRVVQEWIDEYRRQRMPENN